MQFDNLSSEFLKILSPQGQSLNLDAAKLEAFARQFSEGQTLTGQVTQVLSQGRALVNFEGTQVLVELGRSVLPRQVLTVQVDRIQPTPVLKLLGTQNPGIFPTGTGSSRSAPDAGVASSPTRQEGVVTHLSTTGIRREQAFSLRALEHGVRQSAAENPANITGVKNATTGKSSEPSATASFKAAITPQQGEVAGSQSSRAGVSTAGETTLSQNKAVPRIVGQPTSHPGSTTGTAKENPGSQGDVARLSQQSEFKVAPDQFVSRETLTQLKLKPDLQVRLDVLRVQDSQTLVARTAEGTVTVKTPNAGIFKPGDPVIATTQAHQGKFYLEGAPRNQIIQPVTPGMIKPVFPHRQPIGILAAELEQNVLHTSAIKDIPVDPKLIERMQQTVQVLKTPVPETLSGERMQELVNRSGINYEPQVRNLLLEGAPPDTRLHLERDLKGQVLELAHKLEDHVKKMSLPEAVLRQVSDMVQSVQRAIQGIEYHQLNQQFTRQENLPTLLQIPNHVLGGGENIQIYVRKDFEEGKGQGGGAREHYNLAFLLDLSNLGPLRIDTQVRQDGLTIHINSENPDVIQFINSRTDELQEPLQEMGFPAEIIGRVQEKVEMEMPDVVAELMVDEPTRLVDIET